MKQRHFSHRFLLFAGLLSLLICGATAAWALSGKIIEFPIPTANGEPVLITAGPDGNLWFTEEVSGAHSGKIGRITTAGVITEFSSGVSGQPVGITAGPDGNLWFTEFNTNKVGRITSAGVITEFPVSANSAPLGITAGPDDKLWFTEQTGNKIGRLSPTPSHHLSEFPIPTANSFPVGITAGPDGNLWFTEFSGNKIGQVR